VCKKSIKILNRLWKKWKNSDTSGGWLTL